MLTAEREDRDVDARPDEMREPEEAQHLISAEDVTIRTRP